MPPLPRNFFLPNRILAIVLFVVASFVSGREAHAEAAFALGRDNRGNSWYGYSVNERSASSAAELALSRCRQRGPQCELVRQFKLGCFAFAIPDVTNAAGVATGTTRNEAESRALSYCREYSRGRPCTIRESFCDRVDGVLTGIVERWQAQLSQTQQRNISEQQIRSCLSPKTITYAHRICSGGSCDTKAGVIEVLGNNVLLYVGGKASGRGIQLQFGRTVDSGADSDLAYSAMNVQRANPPAGTIRRQSATAAFDGQHLTLYMTGVLATRSHAFWPDNLVIGIDTFTTRFRIDDCSRCTVEQFGVAGHTIGGPLKLPATLGGPIAEQTCKIEASQ